MSNLFEAAYNPDVLSCLANLSNDEVFTPPEIANQVLDLLPEELWRDPNAKFFDPVCKSGVFLREIAKRLIVGLEEEFPDLEERLDHIFKTQLYGIAITELTSLLSRRSLYCSKYPSSKYSIVKFDTADGNIRFVNNGHSWVSGRCRYCGISEENVLASEERGESLEAHAYEFIHVENPKEIYNMKFDVIVGNPPYQLSDGGNGPSAIPLYHHFVEQAKKLNPRYLSMIIPARWFAGGRGLDDFRSSMLADKRIRQLVDFESSKDCFEGVDIAGGICYFLWDRDNPGVCNIVNRYSDHDVSDKRYMDEYSIFIRSNESVRILRKVLANNQKYLDSVVLSQKPFGFRTYARGEEEPFEGSVRLLHSKGIGYVSRDEVLKNADGIDKYKVITGRFVPSNGELDVKPGEGYRVMTTPKILEPGLINTESYITLGIFDKENEVENYVSYLECKFTRFLVRQAVSSVNINRDVFKFVPVQDWSHPWTDEMLYEKYGLTEEEVSYIEYLIRDISGGDCDE